MITNKDLLDFYTHKFDFDNQHKTTYDDWIKAYENSVRKRAVDGCFIGLSSGYDTGALSKELLKQGVKFKAYTITNEEEKDIINKRLEYIPEHQVLDFNYDHYTEYRRLLEKKHRFDLTTDTANMATCHMFELAKAEGRKVYLVGQGGDEIISDYALFPRQSTFKGVFPEKLYEWTNFKEGMQRVYTQALQSVSKLYDIEIRYPYLDVDLVQEFLWLSAELKNRNYKAPLYEYLVRNNVPFEKGVKRGFRPISWKRKSKSIRQ